MTDPWDLGLVYFSRWMLDFHWIDVGKYPIRGSYGLYFKKAKPFTNPSRLRVQIPFPKLRFFLNKPWRVLIG